MLRPVLFFAVPILFAAGCDTAPSQTDSGAQDAGQLAGRDATPSDVGVSDVDASSPDAGAPPIDAGDVPGPLTWRAAAPLAGGPRQETAVFAWQDKIVVLGGYDENGDFGTKVEAYTPQTDTWEDLPDLPVAMHHANAVAVGADIWVVGFLGASFIQDGRIFQLQDGASTWTARGQMPQTRSRASSVTVVHDGAIYLVGGLRNVGAVAHADRFDPATGQWRTLAPVSRVLDHAVGGVIDAKLYIAGGRTGLIEAHEPRLDIFDLTTETWSQGPAMPTSRGGAAGAVFQGALFVIGGEGNADNAATGLFEQVESYDPAAMAWRQHPPLVPARHGMGAASVGGQIFVPGGADVQAFGAVDAHSVLGPQ